MEITKQQIIHTDVLIIGGGTAGCYAALTIREKSDAKIVIAEKANIKRSGCLAAGVNAINAYIVKGRKPQDYVDYARKDADEIVRGDLLLTMSEHLNEVTSKMEQLGLVILKDENGDYVARGNRNIKINGENIKPILADAVNQLDNVEVINHLNITDYIVEDNTIKEPSVSIWKMEQLMRSVPRKYFVQLEGQQGFISQIILDFQDIRCGIHHLTLVPDTQWELMLELR